MNSPTKLPVSPSPVAPRSLAIADCLALHLESAHERETAIIAGDGWKAAKEYPAIMTKSARPMKSTSNVEVAVQFQFSQRRANDKAPREPPPDILVNPIDDSRMVPPMSKFVSIHPTLRRKASVSPSKSPVAPVLRQEKCWERSSDSHGRALMTVMLSLVYLPLSKYSGNHRGKKLRKRGEFEWLDSILKVQIGKRINFKMEGEDGHRYSLPCRSITSSTPSPL
ncbi:hypothetical protein M434DRAFT_34721 [Hypoxylon sp. CO27-5]|nr:hypothetical protein M434DRAFT_34721 [Hypoxylon sp. CO27-5]